jgi:3-hydroxyisobutyrate dehydrogenase-like beta-hydroxyacid dehydrogenase
MIIDKTVTSESRLGFIGLGYLGSRVARRLAAAGFPMVVYDRDHREGLRRDVAGSPLVRFICMTHLI